ncbi:MAG: hypothetical protein LBD75_08150 [Candidatus Peribacteria bacterium]|jgi:hypothetical protein|nr:hypothetical protein [Candidatus Peribacteria bacterium]
MQQINDLEIGIKVVALLPPFHEKALIIPTYDEEKEILLLRMDEEKMLIDNDLVRWGITYRVL